MTAFLCIFIIQRIYQADNPFFSSCESAVIFSGCIFVSFSEVRHRFFQGGHGFYGGIGTHIPAAYRTEGRFDEVPVDSGSAVVAGNKVGRKFLFILLPGVGGQLLFLFPEPIFKGYHFWRRGYADFGL